MSEPHYIRSLQWSYFQDSRTVLMAPNQFGAGCCNVFTATNGGVRIVLAGPDSKEMTLVRPMEDTVKKALARLSL